MEIDDDSGEELDPLREVCEAWASWIRTRRFYKAPGKPVSILGVLTAKARITLREPDAGNDRLLQALNLAIEREPWGIDRKVFELHFRHRVRPIGYWAKSLGISRQHWYVLLRAFEARVHRNALATLAAEPVTVPALAVI